MNKYRNDGGIYRMKRIAFTAAMLFLCLLTGCGGPGGADLTVQDLTGTWVKTMSDGTETLTLNPDMTYKKVIELGGAYPITSTTTDTWSVSGSTISINYSDYHTVSTYTVALDGSTMTWDNGSAQIVYTKKS